MLPSSWRPIEHRGRLIRMGAPHDGGYPVSITSVEQADVLLSMGLNDDWRFEEDFRQRRPGARVICFDHTVTGRFWAKYTLIAVLKGSLGRAQKAFQYRRFFSSSGNEHRRLQIGYDGPESTSLASILKDLEGKSIFLKCDIEGGEYRILDEIVTNQARFTGIAIELHDVDLQRDRIDTFIRELDRFAIVRLHANNFGGVDPAGDPLVIEVTFTRIDLIDSNARDPGIVELPNNPSAPDIAIVFDYA